MLPGLHFFLILTPCVIPESGACILFGAQVSAPEELTSLGIAIRACSGDSLVTHMQAGGVVMAAPPTPVFLNVLGQKVGAEEVGH